MAFSKVILNGTTLIDLTSDTVESNTSYFVGRGHRADGTTFYGRATKSSDSVNLNTSSLWVSNSSFTQSSSVGSSYETVMKTNNQTGNRITLLDPIPMPVGSITIYGNTGYDVAVCAFDSNKLYLGQTNGYVLAWSAFTTNTGKTITTSGSYITFVLRNSNTSVALPPSSIASVGFRIEYTSSSGGGGSVSLQSKAVSYNPSASSQSSTVTADSGYDGLQKVGITITAIPSTYVGSGITSRSSSSLTASGATVTAPAGYYSAAATKAVSSGTATPAASISGTGASVTTASSSLTFSKTISNTPQVSAGYISSGTAGNTNVSLTASINVRTSSNLTASGDTVTAPAGYYAAAATKAVSAGSAGTPTAAKGSVSNHAISVTPSVTNTTGYITGGTKTGTAVSVAASELTSGTLSITSTGTFNCVNYSSASVSIAFSTIYSGSSTPSSSTGSNGDIYIKTS